jgi:hypothetical protein
VARRAAKTAIETSNPEVALALAALEKARSTRSSPSLTTRGPSGEPIVFIPPAEERLLRLSKDKIKISRKRGITFIEVERAHHIGAAEVLGGVAVLEAINLWAQGYHPVGDNPGTWFPQLWLGTSFVDDVSAKLRGKN